MRTLPVARAEWLASASRPYKIFYAYASKSNMILISIDAGTQKLTNIINCSTEVLIRQGDRLMSDPKKYFV